MYINSTDYDFKHIYDLNTLKNYAEYAERDIERCLEAIKKCREYQLGIHEHVQNVIQTSFKKYAVIQRRENWSSKRVEYYVHLDDRPVLDTDRVGGKWIIGVGSHHKMFPGKERSAAILYVKQLARDHQAEIEAKGFKLNI
ncbi:hypothetical protein [Fictibacillus sp. NRS-1165]|uniref:hypothetical protein n=1 Tax=Fictibacillus sp. NRS-1165 TaxID=3144463 RepID=UPI003D1D190C